MGDRRQKDGRRRRHILHYLSPACSLARSPRRPFPTFNLEARLDSTRSDRQSDLVLFWESQVYYMEKTEYGMFELHQIPTTNCAAI